MTAEFTPIVQRTIDRCIARDRHNPSHDRARAEAAYRRRLAATGFVRRIRWLADPFEIWDWTITLDRTARAMKVGALLAPAPDQKPQAPDLLDKVVFPRGWNAARDLPAVGNPSLGAAALMAWQVSQGWIDAAVMQHSPAWDGIGTAGWPAWSTLINGIADGIATNPTLAWLAGPTMPHPILPAFPTTPLQAWTQTAGSLAPLMWGLWRGTTGMDAGLALGCLDRSRRSAATEALLCAYEPMIDAFEAGAFAHSLLEETLLILAAPAIWTDGQRLHRADGPALEWRQTRLYAWKGVIVPERVIMQQDQIAPRAIETETNQEIRRAMIDIFGVGRYLRESHAVVVHEDETGRLWRLQPERDAGENRSGPSDELMAVEVTNGTAEPDGSRRTYWLNVPPHMTTAKEAVSWSYGLTAADYDGLVLRT